MNLMSLNQQNRNFVSDLLASGTSKGELVSLALGVAISNSATVPNTLRELVEVGNLTNSEFTPVIEARLRFLTAVIPLNIGEVEQFAKKHFKTRILLCNNVPRHFAINNDNPIASAFGLNSYMTMKELGVLATPEALALVNGFTDLLGEAD